MILESLGEVYGYDEAARAEGMSPEQRLHFHQEHSGRRPGASVWRSGFWDEPDIDFVRRINRLGRKFREWQVFLGGESCQEFDQFFRVPGWTCGRRQNWTPVGLQTQLLGRSSVGKSLSTLVGPPGFEPGTQAAVRFAPIPYRRRNSSGLHQIGTSPSAHRKWR